MEILQVKNCTAIEIKSSVDGLHNRIEEPDKRISELEDSTTEMIQSEQQREKHWKETQGHGRQQNEDLTSVSSESQKERRKRVRLNTYSKNCGWKPQI